MWRHGLVGSPLVHHMFVDNKIIYHASFVTCTILVCLSLCLSVYQFVYLTARPPPECPPDSPPARPPARPHLTTSTTQCSHTSPNFPIPIICPLQLCSPFPVCSIFHPHPVPQPQPSLPLSFPWSSLHSTISQFPTCNNLLIK